MKDKSHSAILERHNKAKSVKKRNKKDSFNPVPSVFFILLVFLLALSVRLVFLFVFTEIDQPSIGDVWHHWQIAYLSKTIGFKQGFLRLWDFKGMEYYWGLLHPLILIISFAVTGSVSIVIPRIVSTLFGSGVITLVFLIVARHYNKKAAFASALFLILMPTTIFHDTLGLQEPLGLFFLLLGIYFFPNHAFGAGFSWMLAGMVRAEHWIFGAGLLFVVLIREKNFDRKVITLIGYGIPCLLYMKYLLDKTGNAIYPVYWNFLVIGTGEWFSKILELTFKLRLIEIASQFLAVFIFIVGLVVLWKKFRSYLFLLLGLASLVFAFSVFGFGAYLHGFILLPFEPGFIDKIWIGKIFAFPWGFLGILVAIFLLYFLPKKIGKLGTLIGSLIFLVGLGAVQLIWPSINHYYLNLPGEYKYNKQAAEFLASNYSGKGKIMMPAQAEIITYLLVYDEGIPGEKLVASFYGPFYYYEGEDPFNEWDVFREEIVDWLKKENVELFMASKDNENYNKMFELEKGKLFEHLGAIRAYGIYKVKINEE
jgi:hypothetical protein